MGLFVCKVGAHTPTNVHMQDVLFAAVVFVVSYCAFMGTVFKHGTCAGNNLIAL